MPFDIAEVYGQMGLDAIERDCIASIPKKYLLNCLIGLPQRSESKAMITSKLIFVLRKMF